MNIITGKHPGAWIAAVYGKSGIGKSTFATHAPKPLFLDLEKGLDRVDCERTPYVDTWEGFIEALTFFSKSDYETLVIDTVSKLEIIMMKELIRVVRDDKTKKPYPSYAEISWGKGPGILKDWWDKVLDMLQRLKDLGKNVLLIGHSEVKRVDDPRLDSAYDTHVIAMEQKMSHDLVVGRLECVVFAHDNSYLVETEGSRRLKAKASVERVLEFSDAPAWTAKSRFEAQGQVPMTPEAFALFK